jgi:hypothetical protein
VANVNNYVLMRIAAAHNLKYADAIPSLEYSERYAMNFAM